jgi:hypothetical protein
MYLEADIELNKGMHLEAQIERTQRCTWRPYSGKFYDALGGGNRAYLEIHLEAVIE